MYNKSKTNTLKRTSKREIKKNIFDDVLSITYYYFYYLKLRNFYLNPHTTLDMDCYHRSANLISFYCLRRFHGESSPDCRIKFKVHKKYVLRFFYVYLCLDCLPRAHSSSDHDHVLEDTVTAFFQ